MFEEGAQEGCSAIGSSPPKLPVFPGNCFINNAIYADAVIALGLLACLGNSVPGKWPRKYLNKQLHVFA